MLFVVKTLFDQYNPWRQPGYRFPDEIYIPRQAFDLLKNHLSAPEVTALVGARQTGKTFLLKKLIHYLIQEQQVDPQTLFYFTCDVVDFIALFQQQERFLNFIRRYGRPDQINYIFLDEFQRIPNGGLLLKILYDLGQNWKFIISGSSSLEIKSHIREHLTGRKRLFELYPISFREFLRYHQVDTTIPLESKVEFEASIYRDRLEEFILYGGYPGVVKAPVEEDKKLLLQEIYSSYVQKDIGDFLKIENIVGFNRLVQLLAVQTAQLCKVGELARAVGISRYYTEHFLQALQDTYIIKLLRGYFRNLGKSVVKTPKMYFVDTGMRNAVFQQFAPLELRPDRGQLVENFVFSELLKHIPENILWFYRTRNGSEVDFLYQTDGEVIPIEVKYTLTPQTTIPRAVLSLAKQLPVKQAYVLTGDIYHRRTAEGIQIHFWPVWAVSELPFVAGA
ncbi:ATP-binding protein [Candidatus Parcubacteria bacterium]|nr:MAG: ATP-binding protein [Candidatus Parcubacteria bacterium]